MTGHEDHCIEDFTARAATSRLPPYLRASEEFLTGLGRIRTRYASAVARRRKLPGSPPEVDTALEHGYRISYTIV
jgi:hypothetical protein